MTTEVENQPSRRAKLTASVVFLAALLLFTGLMLLRQDSDAGRGPAVASRPPPFALPEATGNVTGDANIATGEGQGEAGSRPACEVRGQGILNLCELIEKGPVALIFVTESSSRCRRQLDTVEQIRRAFPAVGFAAVAVRGKRSELRQLVKQHRLGFPVGYDRDGAVANLYSVAVCPTTVLIGREGRVSRSEVGYLTPEKLRQRLGGLVSAESKR